MKSSSGWKEFYEHKFSHGLIRDYGVQLHSNCFIDTVHETEDLPAIRMTMKVTEKMIAPTGLVHGAAVSLLSDTAIGFGCFCYLRSPATRFAVNNMNVHFLKSAKLGETMTVEAKQIHSGRTLQTWDATVTSGNNILSTVRSTAVNIIEPRKPEAPERRGDFDLSKVDTSVAC